uniref:Uncharacterized protein n=1 Tax=Takifugu rubripes TaxID=31033 RepID=A0A674PIR6_TAKRU
LLGACLWSPIWRIPRQEDSRRSLPRVTRAPGFPPHCRGSWRSSVPLCSSGQILVYILITSCGILPVIMVDLTSKLVPVWGERGFFALTLFMALFGP